MTTNQLVNEVLDELETQGHRRPISKIKEFLGAEVENEVAAYDAEAAKKRALAIGAIARKVVTPARIGAAYGDLYGLQPVPKKRLKRVIQEGGASFGHVCGVPQTVTGSQFSDIEVP